jgi:hypothetical protein
VSFVLLRPPVETPRVENPGSFVLGHKHRTMSSCSGEWSDQEDRRAEAIEAVRNFRERMKRLGLIVKRVEYDDARLMAYVTHTKGVTKFPFDANTSEGTLVEDHKRGDNVGLELNTLHSREKSYAGTSNIQGQDEPKFEMGREDVPKRKTPQTDEDEEECGLSEKRVKMEEGDNNRSENMGTVGECLPTNSPGALQNQMEDDTPFTKRKSDKEPQQFADLSKKTPRQTQETQLEEQNVSQKPEKTHEHAQKIPFGAEKETLLRTESLGVNSDISQKDCLDTEDMLKKFISDPRNLNDLRRRERSRALKSSYTSRVHNDNRRRGNTGVDGSNQSHGYTTKTKESTLRTNPPVAPVNNLINLSQAAIEDTITHGEDGYEYVHGIIHQDLRDQLRKMYIESDDSSVDHGLPTQSHRKPQTARALLEEIQKTIIPLDKFAQQEREEDSDLYGQINVDVSQFRGDVRVFAGLAAACMKRELGIAKRHEQDKCISTILRYTIALCLREILSFDQYHIFGRTMNTHNKELYGLFVKRTREVMSLIHYAAFGKMMTKISSIDRALWGYRRMEEIVAIVGKRTLLSPKFPSKSKLQSMNNDQYAEFLHSAKDVFRTPTNLSMDEVRNLKKPAKDILQLCFCLHNAQFCAQMMQTSLLQAQPTTSFLGFFVITEEIAEDSSSPTATEHTRKGSRFSLVPDSPVEPASVCTTDNHVCVKYGKDVEMPSEDLRMRIAKKVANPSEANGNADGWLDDEDIGVALTIIKHQFPDVAGLSSPAVLKVMKGWNNKNLHPRMAFIINGNRHWVAACALCTDKSFSVYDSLAPNNADVPTEVVRQLSLLTDKQLILAPGGGRQRDSWSCGFFAVAHVVHFLLGSDVPVSLKGESIREHFCKGIEAGEFKLFS